jgi:hypothetical protein
MAIRRASTPSMIFCWQGSCSAVPWSVRLCPFAHFGCLTTIAPKIGLAQALGVALGEGWIPRRQEPIGQLWDDVAAGPIRRRRVESTIMVDEQETTTRRTVCSSR